MSFLEIFQPGLKYLREERDRRRLLVAHPTNGADPLIDVDLDAGTATIVVAGPADGAGPGAASPDLADSRHPTSSDPA